MDHPKFIVSNQKEESISIQRVNNRVELPWRHYRPFYSLLKSFKFDTIDMNIIFADNMDSVSVSNEKIHFLSYQFILTKDYILITCTCSYIN